MRLGAILLLSSLSFGQPYLHVRTLAGSDFTGDGGPASAALFLNLTGVAVDPLGNLYLSDTDAHRVRKIAPNGMTTSFAGTGRAGLSGDGGLAALASLNSPYGVATDYAGSVYIADLGNARIRKITPDGVITTIAGHTPETRMIAPRNVAVDGPGNVFVADFGGHRVYRIASTGLVPIAGTGRPGSAGDGGPATAALLASPAGLGIDPAGNLYIGDTGNKSVRKISAGVITSIPAAQLRPLTATGIAYSLLGELWIADGDGGTVTRLGAQQSASTALPFPAVDIAADFAGNSFAVQNGTVRKINTRGAVSIYGGGNPYYFAGDGGDSTRARLYEPRGLAFDRAGGFLYIADSRNGRVRRVSVATGVIETVAVVTNPQALCWDAQQGLLYIADAGDNAVWSWRPGSTMVRLIAGKEAELKIPAGVAVDDRGNVWISDTGNNRVRLLSSDGKIRTVTSQVLSPTGLVWDPRGFAYVAGANNVFRVTATSSLADPLAGSVGLWREPRALAIDSNGSLLVADAAANRVTRWVPTEGGRIAPVAGSGEAGFDGDRPVAAVSARFDGPSGIALDGTGRILVADAGNHRVRILEAPAGDFGTLVEVPKVSILNAASRAPTSAVAAGGLFVLSGAVGEVAFNGLSADVSAAKDGELTIRVPDDLTGAEAELTIARDGVVTVRQNVKVAAAVPGVFLPLLNTLTGLPVTATDPIERGESITLRVTGEGRAGLPLQVRIRDTAAAVLSTTPSPTETGVLLVEVQTPGGFFPAGTFPLTLRVGDVEAQSGITISIR